MERLGHLIRETRFIHVWRRLYFLKTMLGVPVNEYWNEVILDVSRHPLEPFLESMVLPPQDSAASFIEYTDKFNLCDLEIQASPLIWAMVATGRPKGASAWTIAQCQTDEDAHDLSSTMNQVVDGNKSQLAQTFWRSARVCPSRRSILLKFDWESVKNQAETWEKESGDAPCILAALASQYSSQKRFDDAQRILDRYLAKSPDLWGYEQLATNYRIQGKLDRWKDTLDKYLANVEDLGLDHAKIQVEIANDCMAKGKYAEAKPYAEAAAQTWAQWAMECAGRCAGRRERLGACRNLAQSLYTTLSQRLLAQWYFFCKRNDKGNIDAARDAVVQYIDANADRPDLLNMEYAGLFYWLEGQTERRRPCSPRFTRSRPLSRPRSLWP